MGVNRDLDQIARDLSNAGQWIASRVVDKALEPSAVRVRDTARRLAPRTGLPHYANKITHEIKRGVGGFTDAEIGPERGGQGSLGHLLEFGTSRTPPHAHLGPALDREAPEFEKVIDKLLDPFS